MKTYLKLYVPLLMTTMACAFVQRMIFPPSPTPDIPTPPSTPSPAPTATLEVSTATSEPITCSDDSCLNACLDRLNKDLEANSPEPIGDIVATNQQEQIELVIYKVNGNEISDPHLLDVPSKYRKYQEDTAAQQRIWDFYVAIIPPELRSTIKSFIIFTDGPEETTAWVSRPENDTEYSEVGFDLLDSNYPPYLASTLVHETAHLITLSVSQVQQDDDHTYEYDEKQKGFLECAQYADEEGCSFPDSYINLFYDRFWKDSYPEWWKIDQEAQKTDTFDEYWDMIEKKFYDKHQDWFVNSYAATSVEEDMAESFAYFVLNPKPTPKWIYQQKAVFYYDFPELVGYRRQIVEGLCSYIR